MSRNNPGQVRQVSAAVAVGLFLFQAAAVSAYDAQGKRNPFIPLVTSDGHYLKLDDVATTDEPGLKLEGIIYDRFGISYAVVDGQVVKIGDRVGDYQVLMIKEKEVIFMREGQQKIVELKKEGA